MYLFLAELGLCCCSQAFSSCREQGLLFSSLQCVGFSLCWLLCSLLEHGLQARGLQQLWRMGFSSCGAQAQLLRGMWDLPRPGLEPVSPALAGGFLTTAPPGKPLLLPSLCLCLICSFLVCFLSWKLTVLISNLSFFLFFFFYILAVLHSTWDLSSLTRDQTHILCIGSEGS